MSGSEPTDGPVSSTDPTVPIPADQRPASNKDQQADATAPVNPHLADAPAAPAAVDNKASANPVAAVVGTVLTSVVQTWRGNTIGALKASAETKNFGLWATLLYAIIGGFTTAMVFTRTMGSFDSMLGDFSYGLTGGYYSTSGSFSISFGQWISTFFMGLILLGVFFILRALCVKWVFSTRGTSQTFGASLAIVTGATAIPMTLLLVAGILLIIPSGVFASLIMLVAAVVSLPIGMIPEILIYIGINRAHRFTKSPLIPHVFFTLLWVVMLVVAYLILSALFISSQF